VLGICPRGVAAARPVAWRVAGNPAGHPVSSVESGRLRPPAD
jgi:hypothetical protein